MKKIKLGLVRNRDIFVKKDEKFELPEIDKLLPVKGMLNHTTTTARWGEGSYYNIFVVCAIVNVTRDFNPFDEDNTIMVNYDTDSYQIRPKLIYTDKNGYFYKPFGNIIRLSSEETQMVNDFIEKNKNG